MPDEAFPKADQFEKGGYRPLNDGYSPAEQRGYVPNGSGGGLPKAPTGGTGQTTISTNQTHSPSQPNE